MDSPLLNKIIKSQNRTTTLKVVFSDVQSYSKRRSQTQAEVVDAFMACLRTALDKTSQNYIHYAQENDLNFKRDIIALPSGDGAAVAFPFEGVHDIHLFFAKELLRAVHEHNKANPCDKFMEQGWCHCHSNFNLCVGISDGKGIIYADINNGYNVAGSVVNIAARVMGLAGPGQILFSEEAYRQFIDMIADVSVDDRFREYRNANIKHNLKINVFQYIEPEADYIDSQPVESLDMDRRATQAMETLGTVGFPMPPKDVTLDMKQILKAMEAMATAVSPAVPAIEVESKSSSPRADPATDATK